MSTMIVVVSVVVALALIVWFFIGKNPSQGEGGRGRSLDSESDRYYHRADRPAGPDAEEMRSETTIGRADDAVPPNR